MNCNKKTAFACALFFALCFSLTGTENSENYKKFIKGNIADKIDSIKNSQGDETPVMIQKGIDFALENTAVLQDDRDLAALAVASILPLPTDSTLLKERFPDIEEQLNSVFLSFSDETVRIAVLDKLKSFPVSDDDGKIVKTVNSFLTSFPQEKISSPLVKKALEFLSLRGNSESFDIIYSVWKNETFPAFQKEAEDALVSLSVLNLPRVVRVFSSAKTGELYRFVALVKKNDEISMNFKAEIAENALSVAIHNTEDFSGNEKAAVDLQIDCITLIADANWTRATNLAVSYFSLAEKEYSAEIMTSAQFIQVIECLTKLASPESAKALSGYLAEANARIEKNDAFDSNVVLAVINALGVLGDKSAFDNLLYVTYLNYPEELKNAARESLARLKW